MKKCLALLLTLAFPLSGFALPVGNPKEANLLWNGVYLDPTCTCNDFSSLCCNWWNSSSLRVGYWGNFVFSRDLKVEHKRELESRRKKTESAHIFTNAGYVAYNFCNRADLFATFGATDIEFFQDSAIFDAPTSFESRLDFSSAFSWSIGGRMSLWEVGRIAMGIEGQYFVARPTPNRFVNFNSGEINPLDEARKRYTEWQVGLGLSYQVGTMCTPVSFIPYGAISYSKAHLSLEGVTLTTTIDDEPLVLALHDLKSRRVWGCAIGVTLTLNCLSAITAEADFGSEKALHISGQIRF